MKGICTFDDWVLAIAMQAQKILFAETQKGPEYIIYSPRITTPIYWEIVHNLGLLIHSG